MTPVQSAGLVYSYSRFSSLAQSEGTSLARQSAYAAQYARENNLRLDTMLTMTDKALSAFKGEHLTKGALGVFVGACRTGRVPPLSVLVVESLDRLSRAKPLIAQGLFSEILQAGVKIVTQSDRQEYTWETVNDDLGKLMMLTIVACRAHEESRTKSRRKTETLTLECERWVNEGKRERRPLVGQDPAWLEVTRDDATLVEDRVLAVRAAVKLYLQGHGPDAIAKELTRCGLAMTDDGNSVPHIEKTIRSRALIGEKHVTVRRRMPDDTMTEKTYVLEGYYPAALTEGQWHELQDARQSRGRRRSKGLMTHVLTGMQIARCGYCDATMMANTQRMFAKDGSIRPRAVVLRCMGRRLLTNPVPDCPGYATTSAFAVERAVMAYCSELINLQSLYGEDRSIETRAKMATARARLEKLEKQQKTLLDLHLAAQAEDQETPEVVVDRMRTTAAQIKQTRAEYDHAEREMHATQRADLKDVSARWRELAEGVANHDNAARLQARQLVADTFASILIFAKGSAKGPTDGTSVDVELKARSGISRLLRVDRKGGYIEIGEDVDPLPPIDPEV